MVARSPSISCSEERLTSGFSISCGECPLDSRPTQNSRLYPVWSPDGKRIAYQSNRKTTTGSTFDTYVKSVSGSANNELLVDGDRGQIPSDWSSDGRFVLYANGGRGIWAVGTEGDRKPFPVVETTLGANNAQFSPDGKWIAYQSQESGQRAEIYVQRFPGAGAKSQISATGGVQVRWRRDGKELFYLAADNRLIAVPIRLDSERNTVEAGTPVPLFAAQLSGNPQAGTQRQVHGYSRWSALSDRCTRRGHAADHRGPQLEAKSLISISAHGRKHRAGLMGKHCAVARE